MSTCYESLMDIGTRLNDTHDLELFKDKNYPFSISLDDLEIISYTSIYPLSFLHYIERRLKILQDPISWQGHERDFFGAYLESRLLLSNLQHHYDEFRKTIVLTGESRIFDNLEFPSNEKICEKLKELTLNFPEGVKDFFEELNNNLDNNYKSILFKLHNFNNNLLYKIVNCIKDLKEQHIPHHVLRKIYFQHEDCIIAIIGTSHEPYESLVYKAHDYLLFEKYKNKSDNGIVFAVDTRNSNFIKFAEYLDFKWIFDEKMEQFLAQQTPRMLKIYGRQPGRNEKCPCGSGKKFKKCCLLLLTKNTVY